MVILTVVEESKLAKDRAEDYMSFD